MTTAADRFYTAQEAFIASVAARPAQVQKRARWEARGAHYMRASRVPHKALVQVDTDMARLALQWIDRVRPSFADAYNKHFVPVAEAAFTAWPVLTGLSKSQIDLQFDIEDGGDTFVGSLADTAPYAYYINKGATVRDLVFKPGADAAERMASDLARDLA